MLITFFVLEIFSFLSGYFGYVGKRLDKKAIINSKIYDVTDWIKNYQIIYITQYLKRLRQSDNKIWKFGQLIK